MSVSISASTAAPAIAAPAVPADAVPVPADAVPVPADAVPVLADAVPADAVASGAVLCLSLPLDRPVAPDDAGQSSPQAASTPWNPLDLLPDPAGAAVFVTNGQGPVGWGVHAELRVTGPDAAARIEQWFAAEAARLVHSPGSDPAAAGGHRPAVVHPGPVCFVSLGFSADDESVAVIPEVMVTQADSGPQMTLIGRAATRALREGWDGTRRSDPSATAKSSVTGPGQVSYSDADLSTTEFIGAVETAIARIRAGQAEKVVLAHGLTAHAENPVDERFLLQRLSAAYPSCSTYAVDGLVGASPEMLVRRQGAHFSSRVLAGTAWPDRAGHASGAATAAPGASGLGNPGSATDSTMHRVAADLLASSKDLAEHEYAVRSVAEALAPLTSTLSVPSAPSALELANLTHLSTDIAGVLSEPAPSALALAAVMHPTAAVGGTPTAVACAMIAELEPTPRGRYAAPVGWFDSHGDGEFAIALRCAQISGRSITMMAGCGIVADSDPQTEAQEAQIKMIPIRDALES